MATEAAAALETVHVDRFERRDNFRNRIVVWYLIPEPGVEVDKLYLYDVDDHDERGYTPECWVAWFSWPGGSAAFDAEADRILAGADELVEAAGAA